MPNAPRPLSPREQGEFDDFARRARGVGLVENPYRAGSWGLYDKNEKFREVARIDVGEPGKTGWRGRTHVHISGGKDHLDPATKIPGE
jgi:hypothetical protein